jgi:hypothetical protein
MLLARDMDCERILSISLDGVEILPFIIDKFIFRTASSCPVLSSRSSLAIRRRSSS